jgi:rhamnogalacturonyl hydrolase YesR
MEQRTQTCAKNRAVESSHRFPRLVKITRIPIVDKPLRFGILRLACLSMAGHPASAQTTSNVLPYRHEIIAHCLLANDYWIANNGGESAPTESNNWDGGAYYTGNQRLTEILSAAIPLEAAKKSAYASRALAWCNTHSWEHGPKGPLDPDSHTCGQTYIDFYRIDPQPVRLLGVDGVTGIKPTIDGIYGEGTASDGDWSWIDTFYMAAPVFARLDQTIGETEGRDYSAKLKTMYLYMRDTRDLFDDTYGLWYRDATAKTAITQNGEKEFWARGNGWIIGGLVRVLDELGPSHPDWTLYAMMLQTMSASLIPLQQPDGFWRSSLADPADTRWDNPETSSTAFITYAMAWGINNGLLDATTYRPIVAKAWNGMVHTALHPSGKLGYVQKVARAPGIATYEDTTNYAVGAFMLTGSELSLMATVAPITPLAGVDQSWFDFDGDGSVMVTLDASGTLDPQNKAVSYEWLEGGSPVATGIQADINLSVGIHDITLRITDNDTNIWQDSVRITINTATSQQVFLATFDYTTSSSMTAYGWSALVTEGASITAYTSTYTSQQRVIGVASGSYAYYAPKQDDSTTAAVPNNPALAYTALPEAIDISAIDSVRWTSSGDNADHEFRVAIQINGQWYASHPALNDGVPDSGINNFTPLSFEPSSFAAAANWRIINNTTVGGPTPLSLGAVPPTDLTGEATACGLYLHSGTDNETAGDHVRFDNFAIWSQPAPPFTQPAITSFTRVGGNEWELTLDASPITAFHFQSSPDLIFNPGTLVSTLTQSNPSGDRGVVTGGTTLTTDDTGRAKVRLTLGGQPSDFVRAVLAP